MSKSTGHAGHAPTNGEVARYLEAENPNAPVDRLHDRFQRWRDDDTLPRIRADYSCPECGSSAVFYTDEPGVARCDSCAAMIDERSTNVTAGVVR